MKPPLLRFLAVLDVVGVSLLVPAYIWDLQFRWPNSWRVFPIWLTLSFLVQRDTPKSLGWRGDNFWLAAKQAALFFTAYGGGLLATALLLGSWQPFPLHLFSVRRLWLYFAFCLLQQVALQSFLNNRLLFLISKRWLSSLLAGVIFAAAHWPNPVLVPATLVGGSALAWLFARQRNVLPLAIGQALVGSLLWVCFPVEWHHRMRVGPGYYRPL